MTTLFVDIYSIVLISIFSRISVNILGRYLYSNSSSNNSSFLNDFSKFINNNNDLNDLLDSRPIENLNHLNVTQQVQSHFLSTIEYFMETGIIELYLIIKQSVASVMERYLIEFLDFY